jgi:DNA polymerase-4
VGRSQQVPRGVDPRFGPDADDTGCTVLHVDMDAFYASVEVRRRPQLRGMPVIVGGVGGRGVVSSASYEARAFGVRSAMPSMRARALCPNGIFLAPDFEAYSHASDQVMSLFHDVTPLVEPLSLDEAFLDVAGAVRLMGSPATIAAAIRRRMADEVGLACSVGVAATKFMAKLASTRAKPDGLVVVPAALVLEYLHPLPVSALWGVGERTAENLQRHGLSTIGDVARASPAALKAAVGVAAAGHLGELAKGRDPRAVNPYQVEKSIGAELTYDVDVSDRNQIRRTLLALSNKVAGRMRGTGWVGRTVALKVRLTDFSTVNRSRTLPGGTDVAREIFETAWALFEAMHRGQRIRLIGVRMEGLTRADATPEQLALGARSHGWRDAERAIDSARAKFGRAAVRPASLLGRPEAAGPARSEQEAYAVRVGESAIRLGGDGGSSRRNPPTAAASPGESGENRPENPDDDHVVRLSDPRTRS